MIKNLLGGRIEMRRGHLAGQCEANGIADALTKRAGGRLDARRLVKFWMARRFAVEHAEVFQFLEG